MSIIYVEGTYAPSSAGESRVYNEDVCQSTTSSPYYTSNSLLYLNNQTSSCEMSLWDVGSGKSFSVPSMLASVTDTKEYDHV